MAEYVDDLAFMKNFVKSIKQDDGWFSREDMIKFDSEHKKKFKHLTYKYSNKKFYIICKPFNYIHEGKYLIRNMELFGEEEIKYKNADDLVYIGNTWNPYGTRYYYCISNDCQNTSYSTHWLFGDNVKLLNPDLLRVYDYFVEKNIVQ